MGHCTGSRWLFGGSFFLHLLSYTRSQRGGADKRTIIQIRLAVVSRGYATVIWNRLYMSIVLATLPTKQRCLLLFSWGRHRFVGRPSGHLSRPSALPCFATSFPLLSFDLPESSHKIELFLPIPSKMAIALCSIRLSAVPLPPEVFAHSPPHSLKLTRRFPREQDPQFGNCRCRAARILQLRAKPKKPQKEAGRGRQGG